MSWQPCCIVALFQFPTQSMIHGNSNAQHWSFWGRIKGQKHNFTSSRFVWVFWLGGKWERLDMPVVMPKEGRKLYVERIQFLSTGQYLSLCLSCGVDVTVPSVVTVLMFCGLHQACLLQSQCLIVYVVCEDAHLSAWVCVSHPAWQWIQHPAGSRYTFTRFYFIDLLMNFNRCIQCSFSHFISLSALRTDCSIVPVKTRVKFCIWHVCFMRTVMHLC